MYDFELHQRKLYIGELIAMCGIFSEFAKPVDEFANPFLVCSGVCLNVQRSIYFVYMPRRENTQKVRQYILITINFLYVFYYPVLEKLEWVIGYLKRIKSKV